MWQWVPSGNIQQISYISWIEQHMLFGLMLLQQLGNIHILVIRMYIMCLTRSIMVEKVQLNVDEKAKCC